MKLFKFLPAVSLLYVFLLPHSVRGAVTFMVTPSAVSNTYNGAISLQITGLNTGETVVFQKFLDLNTNGVVDATDYLVEQAQLTDGQISTFQDGAATITNFNVPNDLNPAAGAFTAQLDFQNGDFAQTFIGKYLLVLSSPANRFTAITNSFTVTNFPYAQSISGNVVSNASTTTLPNAVILLFPPPRGGDHHGPGTPIAGVVADNSGHYTVQLPTGSYVPVAFKTNYLANYSTSPLVAVASNQVVTTNLSLTIATSSITGKYVDAATNSIGLPGLLAPASSSGGLIGITFTDTNGNFNARVTSGSWSIGSSQGFALHGYLTPDDNTNVAAGATGVLIPYSKATAIFYGTVKDALGNPLPGISVAAHDDNFIYDTDGLTDANGNYIAGALGGVAGYSWQVNIDNQPTNYVFSQPAFEQNGGTNLTVGQAVQANIIALAATNVITGTVKDSSGNLIAGVGVSGYATINGANYNLNTVDTDNNGNYSLNVGDGTWTVTVNCNGSSDSLANLGYGAYPCPDNQNVVINHANGTANFTVVTIQSYQLYGYILNSQNQPVANVGVTATGSTTNSTTTDGNGFYSFEVPNGTWDVSVNCNNLTALSYGCVADKMANVSGNSLEVDFSVSTCQSLAITTTALNNSDAGFFYTADLQNTGCNPPYTWSLSPGSLALPLGLGISSAGVISGAPSNSAVGTNYFSVRVTDANLNTSDELFSLLVYPLPQITNSSLPNGTIGSVYNFQLGSTGGGPGGLFGWNISSGALPPGLGINAGGGITGTPTQNGTFSFVVSAVDNEGNQPQKSLAITIASLQISGSLTNGIQGVFYSSQLQVLGGTAPYIWTIANGSQQPPANITLSSGGLLSGIPTTNGTFNFIVRVTDTNAATATKSFALTLLLRPTLSAPHWVTNRFQWSLSGATGQNYTVQYSSNLSGSNWTQLFITNSGSANPFIIADPQATNTRGYYRVIVGP